MAITRLSNIAVGTTVKLRESGTPVNYIVVNQGKPSSIYDDSCNGTWLLREDISGLGQWGIYGQNDYANSKINSYLYITFLALFDSSIQSSIKLSKIPYRPGNGVGTSINSGSNGLASKIFLLSAYELGFIQYDPIFPADGAALSYFGDNTNSKRIAKYNGNVVNWWLRSPKITSEGGSTVHFVTTEGSYSPSSGYSSDSTLGVRPALILPSTLIVTTDGLVTTDTAPSAPANITVPSTVNGGGSITVSWDAATDAEDNLAGYKLERSTDGGTTWTQIYQGTLINTTDSITFGWTSVTYRVKAYDTEGLESGYTVSATRAIINNYAPGAPASITVPLIVDGGKPLSVNWTAASDTDGNLSGYALERQVDGGAWTQLYSGVALTYTDAITKGWNTVTYRVRAYDSYSAYSAYTTSPIRSVNNNTAPVISGADTDIGLQAGEFAEQYTVTDAEGDAVTVTESVDGTQIRSFTAALGQQQTVTLTRALWLTLTNGSHQLQVKAADSNGTASVRIWNFSKHEMVILFRLAAPEETDVRATKILVSPTWQIEGATAKIEACNNAFDAVPTWEDITAMVAINRVFNFTNEEKTADKWGVDVRFTIEKNEGYEGEVSISGFGGAYE